MNATLHTHVNERESRLQKTSLYHPFGEPRALVKTKLHVKTVNDAMFYSSPHLSNMAAIREDISG